MEPRICEDTDCGKEFDPTDSRQLFCCYAHANRTRVRRCRARHRKHDGGGGGNGGGNGGGGGLVATLGGAEAYQQDGTSASLTKYYVN